MKHLVTLAFRYLRRQKLRTLLTFMCIALSVFLICSVSAYLSSGIMSLRNNEAENFGTWQVDMSGVVDNSSDPQGTVKAIRDHVSVSDIFTSCYEHYGNLYLDENGDLDYLRITFDGHAESVDLLGKFSFSGNKELYRYDSIGEHVYDSYIAMNALNDDTLAYFPEWLHDDYGYNEGDTIKFSFTPVSAHPDMNDERIRSIIEEKGLDITDEGSDDEDSDKRKLISELKKEYKLSDIPVKNVRVGSAYTVELKIAGFTNDNMFYSDSYIARRIMDIYVPENSVLDISEINRLNPDSAVNNGESVYSRENICFIRTNDALDFDDAMNKLFHDLGYDEEYESVLSENEGIAGEQIHDDLLRWEFRRAGNIAQYIGLITLMLIMIVIAWLLSRFIIDNAFNISVQERSVQFAALRIMGTSKAQIAALVLTEALFYTVTAVPAGAAAAFALCRYVFNTLGSLGNMGFEYSLMKPFALAGTGLCILAIFISALTSALWASRRLSPAEAMNYGKPKLKSSAYNKSSKLGRGSVSFLMNYTKRNLRTHISQNVIATISLALGVMMFLSCLFIGIIIKNNREGRFMDEYDFSIQLVNDKQRRKAHEIFDDNSLFTDVSYDGSCFVEFDDEYSREFLYFSRDEYENQIHADTDMSYDEFRDGHYALCMGFGEGVSVSNADIYSGAERDVSDAYGTFTFHVIGSFESEKYYTAGIYVAEENFYSEVIKAPSSYYYSDIYMKVSDSRNYRKAYDAAHDFAEEYGTYMADNYINCTGFKSLIKAGVVMVGSFIFSVWLAGVFAMISVVNTSVLNRKRELAMMRAVGMTKRQLYGTVIYESVRFSALSTVIGVILGTAFSAFGAGLIQMGPLSDIAGTIAVAALLTVILNTAVAALASIPALSSLRRNLKAER